MLLNPLYLIVSEQYDPSIYYIHRMEGMDKTKIIDKIKQMGFNDYTANKIIYNTMSFIKKYYNGDLSFLKKPLGRLRKINRIPNLNTRSTIAKAIMTYQKTQDEALAKESEKNFKKIFDKQQEYQKTYKKD